jgi:hypothetical protein
LIQSPVPLLFVLEALARLPEPPSEFSTASGDLAVVFHFPHIITGKVADNYPCSSTVARAVY